ncbi:52 kDa repressor of the inhibitor of the protein kinase [Labeo rohita]|uniref:52 kDa repressor of the inhibitor of the protein kinase n=1 Tax=Labeo rohita TaxID=84645 RepID=A0ABQ8MSC6_LABRO|nr:52 kDa repressor of the inhibitor of the protein kinase [Labeo rohita]
MSKRLEEEERKRKHLENVIDIIMDGNSSDLEQLEEEEEEDDEEWVPQAMHDDGSSDSSDEEDYQEESVHPLQVRSSHQHLYPLILQFLLRLFQPQWRWLVSLIRIIQSLAERNLVLRGSVETLHQENNGNFLKEVELLAKFVPVLRDHSWHNTRDKGTLLIAPESTGLGLSTLILKRLEELNIPFQDCRGQSYNNGANMKGRIKGVQARLLEKNPHALYVPCGAHTLNLMVSDAAKASKDATCFFGNVEKLYRLFSGSSQRWAILQKYGDVTLKSWSETRWESRVNSIEPLRYQAGKVREALLEVREPTKDSTVKVEANSLAKEIGSFRFQICCVIWYDILSRINTTSKHLQSTNMQLDVAVGLIKKNKENLHSYRITGFVDAQVSAKEICEQMNTEAVLKEKRLRSTKRHFAYEAADEPQIFGGPLSVSKGSSECSSALASLIHRHGWTSVSFLETNSPVEKRLMLTGVPLLQRWRVFQNSHKKR